MKPRPILVAGGFRIVRTQRRFFLEAGDGEDRTNRRRWQDAKVPDEAYYLVFSLVDAIGRALVRREKRLREQRRGGRK